MIYLEASTLEQLKHSKNLLAFSAGVDSSALFFLLLENNITFDIALVNYNLREQSNEEEAHATTLAKHHNIQLHLKKAPHFDKNFEKNARDFRYNFFDQLMQEKKYQNLITAHQLNDQLEWLLMRLCKGAGTTELIGLEPISKRASYTLIRPILHHSKEELENYLKKHHHHYFIDASNSDNKYERNYFRNNFSDKLIKHYRKGIQKSFDYLHADKHTLMQGYKVLLHKKELYILELKNLELKVRIIDQYLKKLGYLLSAAQRKEIEKKNSVVIGGVWAIEMVNNKIFIAPYQKKRLPKVFKEQCRTLKVPPKIRSYLYQEKLDPTTL